MSDILIYKVIKPFITGGEVNPAGAILDLDLSPSLKPFVKSFLQRGLIAPDVKKEDAESAFVEEETEKAETETSAKKNKSAKVEKSLEGD
jgi:hypothetical protein